MQKGEERSRINATAGRNLKQVGGRQSPAVGALEAKHEVQTSLLLCRGVG